MVASVLDSGAARLAAVWPETSRRVQAYLQRRGLTPSAAEDISQEVAVRALRARVQFVDADDLMPWACTVAWRVHLGELRKTRGRTAGCEPPDAPSVVNVEEEVIARARALQVIGAMSTLSLRDRDALVATFTSPGPAASTPREASRIAVARHRARARLLRALGGLGTAIPVIGRKIRWFAVVAAGGTAVVVLTGALPGPHQSPPIRVTDPVAPSTRVGPAVAPLGSVAPRSNGADPPMNTAGHRGPARSRAAPAPTVLVSVADQWRPASTSVRSRPRTPHDHLVCTGSFILLPNRCVG